MYSLSGYFHISSSLTLEEIQCIPAAEEWLNSHCYFMKLCPSQSDEMANIGVLFCSSIFSFRDDF